MRAKTILSAIVLAFALIISACGQNPSPTSNPTNTPLPATELVLTPSSTTAPASTPTATPAPKMVSGFLIGDQPFKFVGSFLPAWLFFNNGKWDPAAMEDIVRSGRQNGITVFHVMLPLIEPKLGQFDETALSHLDQLLDMASRNHVYLMISFIHAYAISLPWARQNDPYYSPNGIDGLINNPALAQAFKNRIKFLIGRTNSVNGKVYRDDPTILSWIVTEEPISPPFNYASGQAPQVTVAGFKDWLESTAAYIKSLDSNHLVTVFLTGGINSIQGGNWGDWINAVNTPSIDFLYAEDADIHVLDKGWPASDWGYTGELFNQNKPAVIQANFGSNIFNVNQICKNYDWQAATYAASFKQYYEAGASGVLFMTWGSEAYLADLNQFPQIDRCVFYTDTTPQIAQMLPEVVQMYNPAGLPAAQTQFVRVGQVVAGQTEPQAASPSSGRPTWSSLGPQGIHISSLLIGSASSGVIFAGQTGNQGQGGDVYKSTDGKDWSDASNGLQNPDIHAIVQDPSTGTLYSGSNSGVYASKDGGANWSRTVDGMSDTSVLSLAIDPATPTTLYAGTYTGIFKSLDGGAHWKASSTGLSAARVFALSVDPIDPATLYAGTYMGVFKSINNGASWKQTNAGMDNVWVYSLVIDPKLPGVLYAGTTTGVFKSVDGAVTWKKSDNGMSGLNVQAVVIDPATSNLYAGTYQGIFRSTDGGANWASINGAGDSVSVFSLAMDPSGEGILYAGTNDGVFSIH